MVQYLYDADGFFVGIYEGPVTQQNSTTVPPMHTDGAKPQFINGTWLDRSQITVSPVEFKLLWTPQERVVIKTLKSTDPVIEDFYELIEEPRLKEVNLSLQSTQQAVDYLLFKLVEAGTITESQVADRREAILSGKFQ